MRERSRRLQRSRDARSLMPASGRWGREEEASCLVEDGAGGGGWMDAETDVNSRQRCAGADNASAGCFCEFCTYRM
jgi:hypothetical protein